MFAIMKNDFPAWLSERMQKSGLNQAMLAKKVHVNQAAISRILAGKTTPTYDTCLGIARAFQIPVELVWK